MTKVFNLGIQQCTLGLKLDDVLAQLLLTLETILAMQEAETKIGLKRNQQ